LLSLELLLGPRDWSLLIWCATRSLPVGSRDGLDYYREHDSRSIPFFELILPAFSEAASKVIRPAAPPRQQLEPACTRYQPLKPNYLPGAAQLKRICAAMDPAKWNVTFGSEGHAGDKMTAAYSINRDSLGLSVDDGSEEGLFFVVARVVVCVSVDVWGVGEWGGGG